MKKVLIGGFVSLLGSIWSLAIIFITGNNLVSSWHTPPGRFITTVLELDLMLIFVLSIVFVLGGLVIMGIELFRKEK